MANCAVLDLLPFQQLAFRFLRAERPWRGLGNGLHLSLQEQGRRLATRMGGLRRAWVWRARAAPPMGWCWVGTGWRASGSLLRRRFARQLFPGRGVPCGPGNPVAISLGQPCQAGGFALEAATWRRPGCRWISGRAPFSHTFRGLCARRWK